MLEGYQTHSRQKKWENSDQFFFSSPFARPKTTKKRTNTAVACHHWAPEPPLSCCEWVQGSWGVCEPFAMWREDLARTCMDCTSLSLFLTPVSYQSLTRVVSIISDSTFGERFGRLLWLHVGSSQPWFLTRRHSVLGVNEEDDQSD